MATPTTWSDYETTPSAGDGEIDALVYGRNWVNPSITFSFPTYTSIWSSVSYDGGDFNEPWVGFSPLYASDMEAVRTALDAWADVANLQFVEVADNAGIVGDLRFAFTGGSGADTAQAWAYLPGPYALGGDIWFSNSSTSYFNSWSLGSYEYLTVLHEIGHALGLKHPFDNTPSKNGGVVLPKLLDAGSYTVMSYSAFNGNHNTYFNYDPTTPMVLDVAAIQYIYGANSTYNSGDSTYTFYGTNFYNQTIWDSGGIDTLVYASSMGGIIDLRQGVDYGSRLGQAIEVWRNGSLVTEVNNVWIAYGAVIENATGGSGNDTIFGNEVANILTGGAGNDIYYVGAGDTVIELANGGVDTVISEVSFDLSAALHIENLSLVTGAGAINAIGNGLNNTLIGNESNNRLDGAEGSDILIGGAGDDVYVVTLQQIGADPATATVAMEDVITEGVGKGTDTIQLSGDFGYLSSFSTLMLPANIEIFDASQTGETKLNLTGNALRNTLIGNDAANTLNGGVGADTLIGGEGDDVYVIDNVGDVITEAGGEGNDTVQSSNLSIDLNLAKFANIENATLTGSAALNLTGNSDDNWLTGNSGANRIDGGAGADTLIGGLGNDTYYVSTGDTVVELANGGVDTIVSDIDFDLGTTLDVEHLTLSGSGNIDGTGNALANTITGNTGNNAIDGGAGVDTLKGGAGDDSYTVDLITSGSGAKMVAKLQDVVTENVNQGNDSIVLRGSAMLTTATTLLLGANLENLDASGTGSTKLNLTGNASANTLVGNDANNILNGGLGADTLIGGDGDDSYMLGSAGDTVVEYANEGNDTLLIGFSGVAGTTITLADYANIENAILTSASEFNLEGNALNNTLKGNAKANVLTGLGGDDILDGGAGADTLKGGSGNDTYVVDNINDVVDEEGNADTDDLIRASISIDLTLASYANIEHVTLIGSAALNATGNAAANILIGNDGANRLDGGENSDQMIGGKGNDTYVVDNAGDLLVEVAGGGTDTVISSVSWILDDHFENLTLTGSDNIDATGNDGNNILIGNDGENILAGGKGNDTYYAGEGDTIVELDDEGTDTIVSSGSLALNGASSIENLTLSGTGNFSGIGSSAANRIVGNAGNNLLDGQGGVDTLVGGLGNDTYLVDLIASGGVAKLQDTVTEGVNAGNDTIMLRGSLVLASATTLTVANNIENVDASGTGSTKLNLTGNGGSNVLTGNDANNILDGKGGNDILIGGDGDDTYIVDLIQSNGLLSLQDDVREFPNEGNDTLELRGTLVLSATTELALNGGSAIENINASGTGNSKINLTGNTSNNILIGNAAANVLDGGAGNDTLDGGLGSDYLIGGTGNDTFVFSSVNDLFNSIADFTSGDKIAFKASAFSALGPVGALDAALFATTMAPTASAHLFFNQLTNSLYYDADGLSGMSPFALIATFENGATLTAADFLIV